MLAFGRPVETEYRLDADVVVCLDADFISDGPANLRSIREFTSRRKLEGGQKEMSRLYAVECTPTLAGALADHRLPLKPSEVEEFTRALAAGSEWAPRPPPPSAPAPRARPGCRRSPRTC